jgi:putative endonuclease
MSKSRQSLGKHGEQLAAQYLKRKGYALVGANWRCPHGEIDLIMRQSELLIFVEVRTRRSGTEDAFESINPRKRRVLERLAYLYLETHELDCDWRVDVIAVAVPSQGAPVIEHIEDALDW